MRKVTFENFVEELKGKTLTDMKFGWCPDEEKAEEYGERFVQLPQKIVKAWSGTTEGDCDPCIYVELADGTETDFYMNEEITIDE